MQCDQFSIQQFFEGGLEGVAIGSGDEDSFTNGDATTVF
jgi:hypothetical protein